MKKTQVAEHDFENTEVAEEQKHGFWSMFVIMMGFTFFSASMWVGLSLAQGLTAGRFLWAVMAGNLILGIYCSLLAFSASKTGLSIHLLSRYAFGFRGSYIPSAVLAFTQIGWFGVGVAMFSIPATVWLKDVAFLQGSWLTTGPTCSPFGVVSPIPSHLLWSLTIVSGLLMSSSAYFGIKALKIISIVAVPAIAILGGVSAIKALFFDSPEFIAAHNTSIDASTIKSGWDALVNHVPGTTQEGVSLGISMVMAISMGIGSFVSGGSCTPDFTRFAKSPKIAVSTTALAFFIGNSLMFFFGGAAAMVYGKNDISEVLMIQGLLVPAVIVLGLNIWTTNDNALYTSGLGLSNILGFPKRYMVLFNGILGTIAALWLYDNFCNWLNILNTAIPPCGAIVICDYFFVRHGQYSKTADTTFKPVSCAAVTAWACGFIVAFFGAVGLKLLSNLPFAIPSFLAKPFAFGIPAINGMLVAAVVYCAMSRLRARD